MNVYNLFYFNIVCLVDKLGWVVFKLG